MQQAATLMSTHDKFVVQNRPKVKAGRDSTLSGTQHSLRASLKSQLRDKLNETRNSIEIVKKNDSARQSILDGSISDALDTSIDKGSTMSPSKRKAIPVPVIKKKPTGRGDGEKSKGLGGAGLADEELAGDSGDGKDSGPGAGAEE